MLLLQGHGYGEDVESVENLIRRHEEMEREVRVIQERSTVSSPRPINIFGLFYKTYKHCLIIMLALPFD